MRILGWSTLPVVVLALLIGSVGARAQDATVIRETCGEPLRIEAARKLRLGGLDDPGRISQTSLSARDSGGRLILWPYGEAEGHVFDSTGAYITSFGREGGGPGEYSGHIRAIRVGPGDSVHVFDGGTLRHTVLDKGFQVAETKSLSVRPFPGAVRLANGQWVLNAHDGTPDRIGLPLHVLNDDGDVERSFGSLQPVYRADIAHSGRRRMTPAGRDRLWTAWVTEYRLELWDTGNRRFRSLVRDVPWFRPWFRGPPVGPDDPPNPTVGNIHLDANGVLWVIVTRPVENWRDFIVELAPGRYAIEEPMYRAFQNQVVEAVDPDRGCVLARLEADIFLIRALADGIYVAYHQDSYGIPYIDLWQLRLVEPSDKELER